MVCRVAMVWGRKSFRTHFPSFWTLNFLERPFLVVNENSDFLWATQEVSCRVGTVMQNDVI